MSNITKDQLSALNVEEYEPGKFRAKSSGAPTRKEISKPLTPKVKAKGKFSTVQRNHSGMNKTEAAYAQHLDALKFAKQIHDWWFEKVTLKIAPDTRLTVDFMIQKLDGSLEMHDVKGSRFIYQDDAKVKMKVAANMFPFEFYAVFPKTQKMGGGWDIEKVKTDND